MGQIVEHMGFRFFQAIYQWATMRLLLDAVNIWYRLAALKFVRWCPTSPPLHLHDVTVYAHHRQSHTFKTLNLLSPWCLVCFHHRQPYAKGKNWMSPSKCNEATVGQVCMYEPFFKFIVYPLADFLRRREVW